VNRENTAQAAGRDGANLGWPAQERVANFSRPHRIKSSKALRLQR
jgi:hypothetical protein